MDLKIEIEETENKGRAYIGKLAEMTFSKAGSELIIIDHTEVNEELRGQGAGRKLLDALVDLARDRKIKIMPLCPYAKSVFDKNESIRDVLK